MPADATLQPLLDALKFSPDNLPLRQHLGGLLRQAGQKVPERKPILELNPKHPLVRRLTGAGGEAPNDAQLADWAELLFDQALLAEGGQLPDAAGFVRRLNAMLVAMALR